MSNYYLCPSPLAKSTHPDSLIGWSRESIQSATRYLELQPAFRYIQEGMDIVDGVDNDNITDSLSGVKTSATLRNLKEIIASQTNFRIIPVFDTQHREHDDQRIILNKLYMGWQNATFADRSIRKAIQYAAAAGTGYTGIRWEPDYWYQGKGDIILDAYGPLDILPVGLPKNHDLQKAYSCAIKVDTPYHQIIRRYPALRDKIHPDGNAIDNAGMVISQAVKYATAALRKFAQGSTKEEEKRPWATLPVYHIYVDDDTINNTGEIIQMGRPGTSWEYLVPSIGTLMKDSNGAQVVAKEEDCRLYPNRRKIVCLDNLILNPDPYDQVNEFWHGKVPVVQWRMDDWAWCFLGFPITRYGALLESCNIQIMRGYTDSINAMLNPPRAYNSSTMSSTLAETINPRVPNQIVALDMTYGGKDQMVPLLPAEYYKVPSNTESVIEANEARIGKYMGVSDASALARSRQLPSGDSFEKIMDQLGPVIKDQSRSSEASVRDLGEMWKSMAFQFYNAPRRYQLVGPQGVVDEDFDYDPQKMVPAGDPSTPRYILARKHSDNFTFSVTPYSLHEINSVSRKLFHLQLQRTGFPISWWTLADVFDIKNFGKKPMMQDPDDGSSRECESELELWMAQKEIELRMAAAAAQAQGQAGGGKGKGHTGRPPTGQNPPALETKADGRSVVRESKK